MRLWWVMWQGETSCGWCTGVLLSLLTCTLSVCLPANTLISPGPDIVINININITNITSYRRDRQLRTTNK